MNIALQNKRENIRDDVTTALKVVKCEKLFFHNKQQSSHIQK